MDEGTGVVALRRMNWPSPAPGSFAPAVEAFPLAAASPAALAAVLDAVGTPLFLLRRNAAIQYANAAGDALIRGAEAFSCAAGRLTAPTEPRWEQFVQRIADARGEAGRPLAVRPRSGSRLIVWGRRLPGQDWPADTLVLVQITRQALALPQPEVLAEAYDLTAAESRLALALLEGCTLREAAERFGTSVLTVRSQLGAVFAKTGAARQSDLIRLLAPFGNMLR